jgi:anti-sigma factor (TIGR02949 family)
MECNEVRPLIDAYVDRELSSSEARSVQAHLERCAECRRESEAVLALSRVVREAEYHRAPEWLRSRILTSLPQARAPEPDAERGRGHQRRTRFASWKEGWRLPRFAVGARAVTGSAAPAARLGSMAAAALALCAAAAIVVVTLALQRPASSEAFVDELVASHVRAQLSGRDIDVVSSDQHTVKPWFNGRLDYAPPVEDLASSGFALAGGRLDYIGHRRVAVLVYRYRQHVVEVYVFPDVSVDADFHSAAPPRVRDGYALTRWRQRDMVWWAVTDAAPAVLDHFEAALDARLRAGATGGAGGAGG